MIPVNEPLLDGNEKKYLTECIDTGWISSEGPLGIDGSFPEFAKAETVIEPRSLRYPIEYTTEAQYCWA